MWISEDNLGIKPDLSQAAHHKTTKQHSPKNNDPMIHTYPQTNKQHFANLGFQTGFPQTKKTITQQKEHQTLRSGTTAKEPWINL
jgi:hypothetical protein